MAVGGSQGAFNARYRRSTNDERRTRATNDRAEERDDFRACGQSLESPESATLAWVPHLSVKVKVKVKVKDEFGLPMGLNIALPRMPRAVYTGQHDGVWNITLLEPSALASKIGGTKVLLAFQKCFNAANRILSYEQLLDFSRERIALRSDAGAREAYRASWHQAGQGDGPQILAKSGIWLPKDQRVPKPHQPRHRRECLGELVQIDGCEHAWFEDRGPYCTLLVFVDDATSRIMELSFVESDSTFSYFVATASYLKRHGKPVAFYSDKPIETSHSWASGHHRLPLKSLEAAMAAMSWSSGMG